MLSNITSLIQKYDAKMWVMINDDESDKIFTRYFSGDLFSRTICFVTKTNIYLIVCSLDADNLYSGIFSNKEQSRKIVKYYVYYMLFFLCIQINIVSKQVSKSMIIDKSYNKNSML